MQPEKTVYAMSFTSTASICTRIAGVVLLCLNSCLGQIIQSSRYELPLRSGELGFEITSATHSGLVLHRGLSFAGNHHIEIVKLDTAFQQEWRGYFPVDQGMSLLSRRIQNNHLYFLFGYQEIQKKDFELCIMDLSNGNFIRYPIRNFVPFFVTDFQITVDAAIMGGYYNTVPVVLYYSLATQKSKILPGLFNEIGELTQVKTYNDGSFDVLISAKKLDQKTIWIKNYDAEGNLLRNLPLEPEEKKHLIFARSLKTGSDMQLVAGVYGGRNSAFSKGIFIARIDPSGLQHIHYYNYGELNNFFKYMKAKREQRVKERISRRKIRGKKIRFNYRVMVHEIVPFHNQYVLLGEAFSPQYSSASSHPSFFRPSYSNAIIRDQRIFDGFRYTHAVVIGFDPQGKIVWDNSFEINDIKTYTLEQFVKLQPSDDKITLLYLFENELRAKIIQGNDVLEGKTLIPLEPALEDAILKPQITSSKLTYWYPDTFFASGIAETPDLQFGQKRVFFIRKITTQNNPESQ